MARLLLQSVLPDTAWRPEHLLAVWDQMKDQINPFLHVLCISGDLYRLMDAGARRFMAKSFMQYVEEKVMFCRDGTGADRYFLGAPRHFMGGRGMLIAVANQVPVWFKRPNIEPFLRVALVAHPPVTPMLPSPKPAKIPRPPNAYILYRKERHNVVKNANPGISNNEISQILGRAWNAESREVRQKYKEMSEKIKQELLEKHPDYQYKPRKPSEKRRRARRNNQTPVTLAESDAATASPENDMANDESSVDAA